jgi:hypothetical protein
MGEMEVKITPGIAELEEAKLLTAARLSGAA